MTPEHARKAIDATEDLTDYTWSDAHHALETIAGMQEEWGVEVEGKIPGTWYQLNHHGIAPDHYADASWLETREEAESLMEDVIAGEWYENARLVRRYVTQHEVIDGE